jgi:major membrane immunogen (membrane-anchored lipoprotein)
MKKVLIALLLISLVFIFGCGKEDKTSGGVFIGGTKGLDISFVEDQPPEEVLDDNQEEFDITLLLENVGEYDIPKGKIISTLQGINKDAFSMVSLSKVSDFDLAGKQKLPDRVLEGDQEELRFDYAKYKYDLDANFNLELRADVCYEYRTKAVSNICLKKEPTKRGTGDLCEIDKDDVGVDNSAAPVHVKLVRQRRSAINEIKFIFDIEKEGSADVYEPGTFNNVCDEQRDKLDKIRVEVTSPAKLNIKCSKLNDSPKGIVKLISGKKTITCTINTANLQDIAYLERLNIYLDYSYKDSTTRDLVVLAY